MVSKDGPMTIGHDLSLAFI